MEEYSSSPDLFDIVSKIPTQVRNLKNFNDNYSLNILFRALPKEAEKDSIEDIPADFVSLEDDKVSLSESLTEHQSTVADAPPKIPIQGIRQRLIQVNLRFIISII